MKTNIQNKAFAVLTTCIKAVYKSLFYTLRCILSGGKFGLPACDSVNRPETHIHMDSIVHHHLERNVIIRTALSVLTFLLIIAAMVFEPYAARPEWTMPYFILISTMLCLAVITLLNL